MAGWNSIHLDLMEGRGQSDTFETHRTSDLTIVVGLTGRHQIDSFFDGRWRSAIYQIGSAGITPPNHTATLRWRTLYKDVSFRTLHAYLPGTLIAAVAEEYRAVGQKVSIEGLSSLAFRDERVASHIKGLLTACCNYAPDLYASSAAHWLATHILSQQSSWHHIADDPRLSAVITDRRLARVIEYMSSHLDDSITLANLAREAGISVHHFGRRFREATGLTPSAYLATLRMMKARLLLSTTDLAIAEVGFQCGYPHPSGFATAFLRHVGMTPNEYRGAR